VIWGLWSVLRHVGVADALAGPFGSTVTNRQQAVARLEGAARQKPNSCRFLSLASHSGVAPRRQAFA
jgi:hypothetical protein